MIAMTACALLAASLSIGAAPADAPPAREARAIHDEVTPIVGGETFPPLKRARAVVGIAADQCFALYDQVGVLVTSRDRGQSWQVLRNEFFFTPRGLIGGDGGRLFLWGTDRTRTPARGIPFVIESSADAGKSWQPVERPPLDYPLDMQWTAEGLVFTGMRRPPAALPPEKHWFELPIVTFAARDGRTFVPVDAPAQREVVASATALDGLHRAFAEKRTAGQTVYAIFVSAAADDIPRLFFTVPALPEMLWSRSSRVLVLRSEGKSFAWLDTLTGDLRHYQGPLTGALTPAMREELLEVQGQAQYHVAHESSFVPLTRYDQAKELQSKEQYEAAIARFAAFIDEEKTNALVPYALYNMAQCHRELGHKEEAAALCRKIVTEYSGLAPARWASNDLRQLTGE